MLRRIRVLIFTSCIICACDSPTQEVQISPEEQIPSEVPIPDVRMSKIVIEYIGSSDKPMPALIVKYGDTQNTFWADLYTKEVYVPQVVLDDMVRFERSDTLSVTGVRNTVGAVVLKASFFSGDSLAWKCYVIGYGRGREYIKRLKESLFGNIHAKHINDVLEDIYVRFPNFPGEEAAVN